MTSSNGEGAASAASSLKPALRPRRRGQPTIGGKSGISHDPEVIEWVRKCIRAGYSRDQIAQMSRENLHGWPRPDTVLTHGGVSECRAVIAALEGETAPKKKAPRQSGKRLRYLHSQRGTADPLLLDARIRMQKLVGVLESIDLRKLGIGDADQDTIEEIHEELTILTAWTDETLGVIVAHMTEARLDELIRKLTENTSGRSPAELRAIELARQKLERKRYALRLTA